uniref:Uncharacterized protein n=1 Tax=Setaria italica TaxID=4555 RepID=K4AHW5_SETIT
MMACPFSETGVDVYMLRAVASSPFHCPAPGTIKRNETATTSDSGWLCREFIWLVS